MKQVVYYNGNEFFRILKNEGQRLVAFDILNEEAHTFESSGKGYSCNYFELGRGKEIELQENELGEIMTKEECHHCNGDGKFDYLVNCGKPASQCCGGCTQRSDCHECGGEGYTLVDLEKAFE